MRITSRVITLERRGHARVSKGEYVQLLCDGIMPRHEMIQEKDRRHNESNAR